MDKDYNRPRRPNADTLTYLKSLPFNERLVHEEISNYINDRQQHSQEEETEEKDEVEYPQNLSAALSALDEIRHEIASLAGDEFGSQCLETIARITIPYSSVAARKLLHGISDYLVHLSTHRYGSHVVQTIFQSMSTNLNLSLSEKEMFELLELDQDNEDVSEDDNLPSLRDLFIAISEEILPASKELAAHICGSHVLRSLICILSGVEQIIPDHVLGKASGLMENGGNRRGKVKGKKKKKKKKVMDDIQSNGIGNNANFAQYKAMTNPKVDPNDVDIQECLYSLIWELTGLDLKKIDPKAVPEVGQLQQLACNPSAGPLLIVLLRVLTIRFNNAIGIKKDGNSDNSNEKCLSDFRLGITEPQIHFEKESFAEYLSKQILCWDPSIKDSKDQKKAGEIIFGLSGETRGSHMLETLLRTSNDEFYDAVCQAARFFDKEAFADYAQHDVSNFVIQTLLNTVRTRSQTETLIRCVEGLISNGYILNPKNRRMGIFWRAVEMSAKFRIGQETLLKTMRQGFTELQNKEGQNISQSGNTQDQLMEVSECIPILISYTAPEKEGGRIGLDAAGVRTVYNLLRFVPRLCNDVLAGILSKFSEDELFSICNDGLGSRCIIDGILEGPTDQAPFSKATKELSQKLAGQFVALSVERVGQHTVKKIFLKLQLDGKVQISSELSKGINRLSGNAMGRSIISECFVKDYMESEDVWKSSVKAMEEKKSFLKEIIDGDITTNSKKRKRKRKKKDAEENASKMSKEG